MRQVAKIVDITKTFLPIDPQYMAENLHTSGKADYPAVTIPVVAYEGYNFLPTAYGYKSFFGTNAKFDTAALPSRLDKIFVFEKSDYTNTLVALCENGIYTNAGYEGNSWDKRIALDIPPAGTKRLYTTCMIGDELYIYRQGSPTFWVMNSSSVIPVAVTPTFLNMQGQIGIFKAGGRLGFWDSMGSVAWSNFDDHGDFEPSVETLAGSAIFNNVKGIITFIHSFEEGFIIYATKSVVLIRQDLASTFQWDPKVLMSDVGVAYPEQIAVGSPDTIQYFYSNKGMYKISDGKPEVIVTEVTDLLSESVEPIALSFLENRYLALKLIEPKFVEGLVQLNSVTYDPVAYQLFDPLTLNSVQARPYMTQEEYIDALSAGKFKDQQDDAIAAFLAAGIDPAALDAPPVPKWNYRLRGQEAMQTYIDPNNGLLTITNLATPTNVNPIIIEGRLNRMATVINSLNGNSSQEVINCCRIVEAEVKAQGTKVLEQYMTSQKFMWNAADDAVKKYLLDVIPSAMAYATTHPATPGAGSPLLLSDYEEIHFEFGPCRCTSYVSYGKVKAAGIRGDYLGNFPEYTLTGEVNFNDKVFIESKAEIEEWTGFIAGVMTTVPAGTCAVTEGIDYTATPADPLPYPEVPKYTNPNPWTVDPLDIPGAIITLRNGSQGPIYPLYKGALVYDTEYKKWGKMKVSFTQLLDLSPINTNQGKIVTSKRFGIDAAAVLDTGYVHRFDGKPLDSYIKYGKVGYSRLGYTIVEEVRVHFRTPCTGTLTVEGSLDGRNPEDGLTTITTYTNATSFIAYPSLSAQWQNIIFRGNYDISGLEYRGVPAGRR